MKAGEEVTALAEASAMTKQRLALKREAVVRWLRANPGEPLRNCKRATGASEVMVETVAREVGYQRGRDSIRSRQPTFAQVVEGL